MTVQVFDVIVIGAGPAGEVAGGLLADRGRRVAVIESQLVGGECAYFACMPSKALLRPAQALAEVRRVPGAAEAIAGGVDTEATLLRRDEVVRGLDDAQKAASLREQGVTLVRAHGRLDGERRVRAGERLYEAAEAVVLAVGSASAMPAVPGLSDVGAWTNREMATSHEIPSRLIVLGGGAVGVETAQAYRSLGSAVTILDSAERLLAGEEPFAGEQLRAALLELGVDVRLGVDVQSVRRERVGVIVEFGDGSHVVGTEILVAAGRRPRTDDLGLDTVGLRAGEEIDVDDTLRVPGLPWLYAIGDVNGRSLQTHMGKYQARVVADVIAGGHARATRDDVGAPRVVFTEPQVAAVGLTLQAARDAGLHADAYDVASAGTAGASFHGRNTPGIARLVVDENRAVVVGATFSGVDVAEWLQAATICVVGEIPVERLWEAVPAFPTRTEIWLKLLEKRAAERRRRQS